MQPETRYARLGRDRIAYQVLGRVRSLIIHADGRADHQVAHGPLKGIEGEWQLFAVA